jgi:hypothetical protein
MGRQVFGAGGVFQDRWSSVRGLHSGDNRILRSCICWMGPSDYLRACSRPACDMLCMAYAAKQKGGGLRCMQLACCAAHVHKFPGFPASILQPPLPSRADVLKSGSYSSPQIGMDRDKKDSAVQHACCAISLHAQSVAG